MGKEEERGRVDLEGQAIIFSLNPPVGGILNLNRDREKQCLNPQLPVNYLKGCCQKDEFVTVAVSTAAAAVIMARDPTPGRAWYMMPGGASSCAGVCGPDASPEAQVGSVSAGSTVLEDPGYEMCQATQRCLSAGPQACKCGGSHSTVSLSTL